MNSILKKYADLLVNYSVSLKLGEKVLIKSSTLGEPLVREIYRSALRAGGHPEVILDMQEQVKILLDTGNDDQLSYVPLLYKDAMETFDAYIHVRAPFNLREMQNTSLSRQKIRQQAFQSVMQTYSKRTATLEMKRTLCQYPTHANAQEAGMSLEEYSNFVFGACNLFADDPVSKWLDVRKYQQKIVDLLNSRSHIRYRHKHFDISFSTKGRTWINSDGQTNMPSGEVYTSPVEDSVNGTINFSLPAIHGGNVVEDVTLHVKDGLIEKWEAKKGQKYLDKVFKIPGTRRFGEAAIGTNKNIQRLTKNILFDEKIGGTIHMAIGQSYLIAGGQNQSSVHWDMITDMTNGGEILADDELIYKNGEFIFLHKNNGNSGIMASPKKIGLFFGSFNPIHVGHMIIANYVVNHGNLDQIWMVVSPQNPLKPKHTLAKDYDRLHLVREAIGDNPKLKPSDIEFKLPQPSYTIDTLAYLKEKHPDYQFVLIMGGDNLGSLNKWKNYEIILRDYEIFVYKRPTYELGELAKHPHVTIMDAPLLEISASYIRKCIKEDKSIRYLVTERVYEAIKSSRMYR